jgi:hypothetical protein
VRSVPRRRDMLPNEARQETPNRAVQSGLGIFSHRSRCLLGVGGALDCG